MNLGQRNSSLLAVCRCVRLRFVRRLGIHKSSSGQRLRGKLNASNLPQKIADERYTLVHSAQDDGHCPVSLPRSLLEQLASTDNLPVIGFLTLPVRCPTVTPVRYRPLSEHSLQAHTRSNKFFTVANGFRKVSVVGETHAGSPIR